MLSTDPPLANAEDMNIPKCVANADEAMTLIREHHTQWLRVHGTKSQRKRVPRTNKRKRT
jgi:hypothetical protein